MPAPKPPRKLVVYANPYFQLDHNGMPCGAVRETSDPRIRRWVGAKLCVRVNASQMVKGVDEVSDQDNWFEFSGAPVTIDDTRDHRAALKAGHLFPADAHTARRGSYADKKLDAMPLEQALDAARKEAVAKWMAHYGEEPAFIAHEAEFGSLHAPAKASDTAPEAPAKPSARVAPAKGA
jgi:hypothetical protein